MSQKSPFKFLKSLTLKSLLIVSQLLPRWKKAAAIHLYPPLLSLPVARPVNFEMLTPAFGCQFISIKSIPGRKIFILKNVFVSGQAVVFKNFRIFIKSLTWERDIQLFRDANLFIRQFKGNYKTLDSDVFALVYDDWSAANYYHWMIEALPKLMLVKKAYPNARIIVPSPAPEFILATLNLLQFDNLETLGRYKLNVIKVPQLILPELVYYEQQEEDVITRKEKKLLNNDHKDTYPVELIEVVREQLVSDIIAPVTPNRKIFISRSRQKTRRLLNEEAMLGMITAYGFEIQYFEEMSFWEQRALMLQTSVFLSIHGSNMVNILFLQPGSKVIELMNQEYVNDAYYLLASTIRLPYFSVPCTMQETAIINQDRVALNDADIIADEIILRTVLEMALK
ncbi:hypothetical protein BH11BAC3_BH11BAC3_31680 [soil metagenome]